MDKLHFSTAYGVHVPKMLSQKLIAEHLGLSVRRVHDVLPQIGCSAKDGLDAIRLAYIRHLRDVAAGRGVKTGDLDLVAERARLAKEQADLTARKNSRERGELVSSAEVQVQAERVFGAIRSRMLAWPSKLVPQLVGKTAQEIGATLTREVRQALTELATFEMPRDR